MAGISRLLPPSEALKQDGGPEPGLTYSIAFSTTGNPEGFGWQPPLWPHEKSIALSKLLGVEQLVFRTRDGETRVVLSLPRHELDNTIIDELLRSVAIFQSPLPLAALGESGRFLTALEVDDCQIAAAPGALYRAFATAKIGLGVNESSPGSGVKALEGWNGVALRFVAELFGSAVYFKRIGDSHVLIIQIDHDENEVETLRKYFAS